MFKDIHNKNGVMESITTVLCGTELLALKTKREEYRTKSDTFLKKRGFEEAVGKFTNFRLHDGNLEVHVDGLGSSGCLERPEDDAFVTEMSAVYADIECMITSIRQKAHQSFKTSLDNILL